MAMTIMKILLLVAALAATCHAFSVPPKAERVSTKLFVERRDVLASGFAATVALTQPLVARADQVPLDYAAVANDVSKAVQDNPDWGPTLVRLAWHSSGTYDKMTKTGGSGEGTIRFKEELAHGGNAGLADTAVKWLEPIHEKYANSGLSYADLYTLAGGKFVSCKSGLGHSSSRHSQYRPISFGNQNNGRTYDSLEQWSCGCNGSIWCYTRWSFAQC